MNFPTHFHDHWRGQRDNSFNRVLRNDFAARSTRSACGSISPAPIAMAASPWWGLLHNTATHRRITTSNSNSAAAIHRHHAILSSPTFATANLRSMRLQKLFVDYSRRRRSRHPAGLLGGRNAELLVRRRGSSRQHRRSRWSVNKRGTHNAIQRELIRRDAWQGRLYTKPEFRTSLPSISSEGVEP